MISHAQMLELAVGVARVFELAGIGVIILGTLFAMGQFVLGLTGMRAEPKPDLVPCFRKNLGRSILAGLELLVAADIIQTVAVEPTLESVIVLAGIVLIRTFLSFSLEVEIEGKWPWRQAKDE